MADATDAVGGPDPGMDWRERAFDLTRGIAAYTGSGLIAGLARVIARYPQAEFSIAFNHRQVASKLWARQKLYDTWGGDFGTICILGGWYGVLAAMLLDDRRFHIGAIASYDIDPGVAPVAETLVGDVGGRFQALTADMYALDYASLAAALVVNTSCEHIADLRAWLALLPMGQKVLLQSNDYVDEPSHVSPLPSLEALRQAAGLGEVRYAGALKLRTYTRFMLIGQV